MSTMTTSPGPARRAYLLGLTPAAYAAETVEAFETLAWIDRTMRHRVRGGGAQGHRDSFKMAARLLVAQYHSAVQLGDMDTAAFVQGAVESLGGVVEAHRLIRDGD